MAIKFVLFCFFFALLLPLQALRISRQSFLSGNTTSVQREMIDFETQRDYLQVLLSVLYTLEHSMHLREVSEWYEGMGSIESLELITSKMCSSGQDEESYLYLLKYESSKAVFLSLQVDSTEEFSLYGCGDALQILDMSESKVTCQQLQSVQQQLLYKGNAADVLRSSGLYWSARTSWNPVITIGQALEPSVTAKWLARALQTHPEKIRLPLPPNLIALNSTDGTKLLSKCALNDREEHAPVFWQLVNSFTTQERTTWCALGTIVTILNSVADLPKPKPWNYAPYSYLSQDYLRYNCTCTKNIIEELPGVPGVSLEQFERMFRCFGFETKKYYGNESTKEMMRKLFIDHLKLPGHNIIINYAREAMSQGFGGHFSPIAAYNEELDRFLIFDVARYKFPPVWAKTEEIFNAVNTTASRTDLEYRGFMIVNYPNAE